MNGGLCKWSISLCGSSKRGGEPLLGTPKVMLSKALEMGVCFHRGLILGNMWGHFFPRAFKKRVKFILSGELQ